MIVFVVQVKDALTIELTTNANVWMLLSKLKLKRGEDYQLPTEYEAQLKQMQLQVRKVSVV